MSVDPTPDCPRHPRADNSTQPWAWNYVRCLHRGHRFVVDVVNPETGAHHVDYVHERDGRVECLPGNARDQADADALWARMTAMLNADEAIPTRTRRARS